MKKVDFAFRQFVITTLLLGFSLGPTFAQSNNGFSAGFSVNPMIVQQIFEDDTYSQDQRSFGISGNLDVFYRLTRNMSLKSGLSYQYNQVTHIDNNISFDCDFEGESFDPNHSRLEDQFNLGYLGIPLGLRYNFDNDNRWYTGIELESLFKIDEERKSYLIECGTEYETDLRRNVKGATQKVIFIGRLSSGYNIDINSQSTLSIEPNIAYSLGNVFEGTGITSGASSNIKIVSLGISLGLRF